MKTPKPYSSGVRRLLRALRASSFAMSDTSRNVFWSASSTTGTTSPFGSVATAKPTFMWLRRTNPCGVYSEATSGKRRKARPEALMSMSL